MLDNANTMNSEGDGSAMYQALMAVRPEGLSLSQWAARAGINRSIFNGIRAHGNPTTQTLDKLLTAIEVDPADFRTRLQPVRTEVRATGMSAAQVRDAWSLSGAKAVPLLGTAFGGEWLDDSDVETTELRLAEVLDYLARPPSLAGDDDAYAVEIVGESMAPRFEPGEQVFVSPKAAVRVGDDVIVQLKAAEDVEGSDLAGQVTAVLIKRLVRRTAAHVELRQFNPDTTFKVPLERVRAIHRVRGRL
jgi:phage repressor protein C with HTH and peptisase S24 domain